MTTLLLCGALALGAQAAVIAERAPTPKAPIVKTRKLAPGLTYTKIVQRAIPRRTFVLKMDPSQAVTLDVTITQDALPAQRALSAVAIEHGALAAVNGDYSGQGNPEHPLAQDGELLHTSPHLGTLFAMARDETQTYFGRPDPSIHLSDLATGLRFDVARWNEGPPVPGEIVGFSPLGGTLELPPPFACSVRLLPVGPPSIAPDDGVDRDYVVDVVACSEDLVPRSGGVVLSAAPATDEATQLLALEPGTRMRLHWTFGWPGVFDAVGGFPLLVQDGRIVQECNASCDRQPRTGIGVTASGKVLLVVIDGRQRRWSLGVTSNEFAQVMLDLGAVDALNLDGGGSSEMVVEGVVVNSPSDGQERAISNAILILPGSDPGEPGS